MKNISKVCIGSLLTMLVLMFFRSNIYSDPAIIDNTQQIEGDVVIDNVIDVPSWNGVSGGVYFLEATGTVTITEAGVINATGKGYRGGAGGDSIYPSQGQQGESILGRGGYYWEDNGTGGGGGRKGGACCGSFGGGGGAHVTDGTKGEGGDAPNCVCPPWTVRPGRYGRPGIAIEEVVDFGGGGGGGNGGSYWGTTGLRGGNGAGIIKIKAQKIIVKGKLEANGANGQDGPWAGEMGGGGGGGGGTIWLEGKEIIINGGTLSVTGGQGSRNPDPTFRDRANGGDGGEGLIIVDGLITTDVPYLDVPLTYITLTEKLSIMSTTSSEDLRSRKAVSNNVVGTGDISLTLQFTNFEMVEIETGTFTGKGFTKVEFEANIGDVSYKGYFKGTNYFVPSENKIYLNGEVSGDISGIAEGFLTESTPGSGFYGKYQARWKLNRVGTDTVSATINLDGNLSYQSSYSFTSQIYLYQANMEGSCYGYYTGPLSAVVTNLRLISEGEYQNEGFSIISYNSNLGSGEAWAYNRLAVPDRMELNGLFESPILGRLHAFLDESSPLTVLTGTIERLDIGLAPAPLLSVNVWGPQRISPGQKIDYIIEYRNDGLKPSEKTLLFVGLDYLLKYILASPGAYHNDVLNTVDWDLGNVPPKSSGYLSIQVEVPWGLSQGTTLETDAIVNELLPHSDKKGIFVNGIGLGGNERYAEKCKDFASDRKLDWVPAYDTETLLGDIYEVNNAFSNIATEHNGLLDTKVTGGHVYETVWGYSGGTRTVVTAIQQYGEKKLRTKELVLISPVLITTLELWQLQLWYGVEKIIIYQSEKDIFPPPGVGEPLAQLKIPKGDPIRDEDWLEVRDVDTVKHVRWLQHLNNEFNKNKENMASSTPSNISTAKDPNEKLVYPEGDIRPGDRLDYTINYENEGEGIAYGVYITDTLDEDLDVSTLLINNNGSYNTQTRTIAWFIGEVGPHQEGSVTFSINTKLDLPDGTEIINFATVYFPSVPEVTRTNGTVNRIPATVLDTTSPETTLLAFPLANQRGWNNTDVTITLTAEDASGVKEIHYTLIGAEMGENIVPGNTTQITVTTEGITNLTYWAVDNAGNIEPVKSLEIRIDKTPPVIIASSFPQPNFFSWNNTNVTISFTASDNLSGVASVTEPITVITEGTNQYIEGETVDLADNRATTYAIINIDKTSPAITATSSPLPNSYGWNNTDVTVSFNASDNLSGIQSITSPISVTTEGENQIIQGETLNLADNRATTYVSLNIDKTSPTVTITATPNILWPPNHKMVNISISGSTTDDLSGIASTTFEVDDEYNTVEPVISGFNTIIQLEAWRNGNDLDGRRYDISVTAKDKAGNEASNSTAVICSHDQRKK